MQCDCGSDSKPGDSKFKSTEGMYILHFQICRSCSRVGGEILFQMSEVGNEAIAWGTKAREDYALIEEGALVESTFTQQKNIDEIETPKTCKTKAQDTNNQPHPSYQEVQIELF